MTIQMCTYTIKYIAYCNSCCIIGIPYVNVNNVGSNSFFFIYICHKMLIWATCGLYSKTCL